MKDPQNLNQRKVLVVGGGSGMGKAIAQAMNALGASVAIAGRREDKLSEVAQGAKGSPPILFKSADVTDRSSLDHLFQWFDREIGSLDILIHAAGINVAKRTMIELQEEDWDRLLKINLTGGYNCLRLALERMRPRGEGLVVLINSVAGKRSAPLAGIGYNASKFGLSALGIGVGEEERENGIRITNVYPGEVNTEILDQRTRPPSPEHRASILQPEDVASVVVNLTQLPNRAHVPELVIKPTRQSYL